MLMRSERLCLSSLELHFCFKIGINVKSYKSFNLSIKVEINDCVRLNSE